MKPRFLKETDLDRMLARLLQVGTLTACAFVCAGVVMMLVASSGYGGPGTARYAQMTLSGSVALFIALPALRVVLMLAFFAGQRNYRYVMIAAIVLTILATGCVLELRVTSAAD
jgi:uncharacterized membrane protein